MNKKFDWTEAVILTLMCLLTPVMAIYFGTVLVMALIPTAKVLWALVCCLGILIGTLFSLLMELSPVLAIFAIPMLIGLFSDMNQRGR